MQAILSRLIPFLIAGFIIVIAVIGLVVVSYILLWGALIGAILYFIAVIKQKLFPHDKTVSKTNRETEDHSSGRIIDVNESREE